MVKLDNLVWFKYNLSMKIALFTDSFFPGIGGTEKAVYHIALALSKDNEVMVVAPNYHRIDERTYPFKVVRFKSLGFSQNDFWAMPFLSKKAKKEIAEFAPDIIHCHTVGTTVAYANKYAKKHGVPLVYTVHTKFRYCYKKALKIGLFAEILLKFVMRRPKKADHLCSVCNSMKSELKSYGIGNPVTVVRNGCNFKKETPKPKDKTLGKINLIFVGLMVDFKRVPFILETAKRLKEKGVEVSLKLVGAGADLEKYKRQVKKLGIEKEAIFMGRITNPEILKQEYQKSDLLIFPSVFDNAPLTVLEAGSLGVPSVVVKDSGASEALTDGVTGFTCDDNIDAFVDRIYELAFDKELLEKVSQNTGDIFNDWETSSKEYYQIYQDLIEKKNTL